MVAKRFLIPCALVVLSMFTGCRTWCERHYPCPQPQTACVPCCPPNGGGYYQPTVPAPPAPVQQNWGGQMDCTCVPSRR